jgi:uncharacterized phiE125 gp8 family phage protein
MQYGNATQTVGPTVEPVTRAEAKEHCRYDDTDEDSHFDSLITAAREQFELATGRQLITATWVLYLDAFPSTTLRVPHPPLQSDATHPAITYVDTGGTVQTWPLAEYDVDVHAEPGRITPAYGYVWPTARSENNAITVTYKAGYGTTASTVPRMIRQGILFIIAQWFEFREPVVLGRSLSLVNIPTSAQHIINHYKTGEFI